MNTKSPEQELFDIVHGWGRAGVVIDYDYPVFKDLIAAVKRQAREEMAEELKKFEATAINVETLERMGLGYVYFMFVDATVTRLNEEDKGEV